MSFKIVLLAACIMIPHLVLSANRPISDVTSRHVPLRTGGQACKQIARVSEKRVENIVDLFALW